jgi:hypothetical protein
MTRAAIRPTPLALSNTFVLPVSIATNLADRIGAL